MDDTEKMIDDILEDYGGRDENGTYTSGQYELLLQELSKAVRERGEHE